jgi:hypothetical protein
MSEYFHTDDPDLLAYLGRMLTDAAEQGGRVRFDVTPAGNLKVKFGEGMWSAPHWSTPDPYRDAPRTYHMEIIRDA